MSLNRNELRKKIKVVCSALLTEKGYISFVDIFMKLGYLSVDEYEAWRMKKHPCLEQVIHINLSKISYIMKEVRTFSRAGKLIESNTVYMSWGKGKKIPLRFSKSGKPAIEKLYSTHFVSPSHSASGLFAQILLLMNLCCLPPLYCLFSKIS